MDCNKSKMKKKKYMKENEDFTALKDYYKNILLEGTSAKAERTDLRDFNPKDVAGNKRNPIDNPRKQTGKRRKGRAYPLIRAKPAPRFVNPAETPRNRPPRTEPSVDNDGRQLRRKARIFSLSSRMTDDPKTGLNYAADELKRRRVEIPGNLDPRNLPSNFYQIANAYDEERRNRARLPTRKYFK
jgi:hypothetical protein